MLAKGGTPVKTWHMSRAIQGEEEDSLMRPYLIHRHSKTIYVSLLVGHTCDRMFRGHPPNSAELRRRWDLTNRSGLCFYPRKTKVRQASISVTVDQDVGLYSMSEHLSRGLQLTYCFDITVNNILAV